MFSSPSVWLAGKPHAQRTLAQRALSALCTLVVACGALLAIPSISQAQLTAKSLIGDSVSSPESPKFSDINEAIKRYQNRDVLSARQFLETAKRKDSKLPPVGVLLAKMHLLSGNGAAVRPALEQSINEDADDPEPYLLLAEDTLNSARTIEADALFDKTVDLINNYNENAKRKRSLMMRAYRGRATVAERRKKWDMAEQDLKAWLEQDPDDATAHSRLGQVLYMLEKPSEGFKHFTEAVRLNEKLPNPHVLAATVYERRGEQENAIAEFTKAYRADAENETTLVTFAQSLLKADDLKKAEQILNKARSVAPESFNVWLLSGVSARMSGKMDAAEQAFTRALSLQPSSREVYNQLALLLGSQEDDGKRARALQFASTNAKLYPKNNDIMVTMAWVLYESGKSGQATQILRQALQTGGGLGADAQFLVAKILAASKQKDNARRILTSALADTQGIFVQRAEAEKLLNSL